MMHQRGQDLLQLQEQAFARGVVVGPHVEFGSMFQVPSFKQLHILLGEQGG